MSNDEADETSEEHDEADETFEDRLASMYDRYRRQHLEDELDALATTMEETLLQQRVAETFFEATIDIDGDVKADVEATVDKLEAEEYDAVEEDLDELAREVERAETHVTNRIQQLRLDRRDTATAMRRLNERVERVDPTQLQALEDLLGDWNWRGDIYEGNETFESRREAAAEYGESMKFIFESLKDDLFGPYQGTELKPLVDDLLDEEPLRLGNLTEKERGQLADSDLADYVELRLS